MPYCWLNADYLTLAVKIVAVWITESDVHADDDNHLEIYSFLKKVPKLVLHKFAKAKKKEKKEK